MTDKKLNEWKQIKEIDVGGLRSGWMVKNDNGDIRLLLVVDQTRFSSGRNNLLERVSGNERNWIRRDYINEQFEKEREKFKKSVSNFQDIVHGNVAQVYELTTDDKDQPTAIMEYPFGKPITKALEMAPIDIFMAHFKQVFEAVAFFHKLGLLHLNICPKYTLTDLVNGVTKIVDCWDVHKKEDKKELLNTIRPCYASPEVIMDGSWDERSDIYSVAVMMWEAWMGYNPFLRTRSGRKLYLVQDGLKIEARDKVPRPMDTSLPEYDPSKSGTLPNSQHLSSPRIRPQRGIAPPELGNNLVLKLLNHNPDKRGFASAQEIVNYIIDTWPNSAKPTKDIFGKVMTTMRLENDESAGRGHV